MRLTLAGGIFLFLLSFVSRPAIAGDCIDGDSRHYLTVIENVSRGKRLQRGDDPFHCLDIRFGMTNRWAGPRAEKMIATYRKSPLRKPLMAACSKILGTSQDYWHKKGCVRLMAAYGIPTMHNADTLTLQAKYFPHGLDPGHLAALGDLRAIEELIKRFDQQRVCYEYPDEKRKRKNHCKSFENAQKNKWERKARREYRISILNALWHLAGRDSLPFLKTLSSKSADALLRDRAQKVIDRIEAKKKK